MDTSLLIFLSLVAICSSAAILDVRERPRPGREVEGYNEEEYQLPQRRSMSAHAQRKFRFFPPRAGDVMMTSLPQRKRELCDSSSNKRCAQLWDEAGRVMEKLIEEDSRMIQWEWWQWHFFGVYVHTRTHGHTHAHTTTSRLIYQIFHRQSPFG